MNRFTGTFYRFASHLLILIGLVLSLSATPVSAQTKVWTSNTQAGGTMTGCVANNVALPDGTTVSGIATIQGVECLVGNILATATTFIGLIAFVMVIVGAFYYLTSGGNSSTMELGKKSITYGIIGIIVALMAYFILVLLSDFTGVDRILQFNLNVEN